MGRGERERGEWEEGGKWGEGGRYLEWEGEE